MFIKDGIVCGGEPDRPIKVEQVRALPDMMVLDPPREGMTPKALERILSYEVPRLVYVSCKPESLARDMETFAAHGYRIERARCVDMFPWTRHVETLVLLSHGL